MVPAQRLFASWSLLVTVVVYGGGGGIEPTAPIVVVDSGIGGLCQQWLSLTEAAVGWSQWR
jgi:hypothetical protein